MAEPLPAESSSSGAKASTSGSSGSSDVLVGQERKDSCVPKFDALWFCYSPAHQLQQYYIRGTVDDCTALWTPLIDCLKKRTRFKEEVLQAEAEERHPLWDIRTHSEASEFWQREFGHLSQAQGDGSAPEAAAAGAAGLADGVGHRSGRPTLV